MYQIYGGYNFTLNFKMEDGRWEMEDGRWKMGDGRWEMEDGRWKMGDFGYSFHTNLSFRRNLKKQMKFKRFYYFQNKK